jgi:hypothetical protein
MAVQRKVRKVKEVAEVRDSAPADLRAKKRVRKAPKPAGPAVTIQLDPFADVARPTSVSAKKKPAARGKSAARKPPKTRPAHIAKTDAAGEALSPAFETLANVRLPELRRDNRARLQLQSPTRLHFYWSLRENPSITLRKAFGYNHSYTLILKLIDLSNGVEEIHPCEASGDWWFEVEPNTEYRAEIGFYAPNRPYIRVIYSNGVVTPRRTPSPRPAAEAQWRVSADKFAQVLDVAGFSRDAFDVALAGDDHQATDDVTRTAFLSLINADERISTIPASDIRYAMLSIASGVEVRQLEGRVNRSLYEILSSTADSLQPNEVMQTLTEHFDICPDDFPEGEYAGPAVFGVSLINFPKTLRRRKLDTSRSVPRPLSSHSIR